MKILAKKNLYHNDGTLSFTNGQEYEVPTVKSQHELIDCYSINNQGERHQIGMWYKYFKIIK